jgi:hypothetical protein
MLPGYDPRASQNDNERTPPGVNSVVYWPVGRFIHLCTLRWSDDGLLAQAHNGEHHHKNHLQPGGLNSPPRTLL